MELVLGVVVVVLSIKKIMLSSNVLFSSAIKIRLRKKIKKPRFFMVNEISNNRISRNLLIFFLLSSAAGLVTATPSGYVAYATADLFLTGIKDLNGVSLDPLSSDIVVTRTYSATRTYAFTEAYADDENPSSTANALSNAYALASDENGDPNLLGKLAAGSVTAGYVVGEGLARSGAWARSQVRIENRSQTDVILSLKGVLSLAVEAYSNDPKMKAYASAIAMIKEVYVGDEPSFHHEFRLRVNAPPYDAANISQGYDFTLPLYADSSLGFMAFARGQGATPAPEPGTTVLFLLGFMGLLLSGKMGRQPASSELMR